MLDSLNASGLAVGSELPSEQERGLKQEEFSGALIRPRQVPVARTTDTSDRGGEREHEERGPVRDSAVDGSPRIKEDDDTHAVGSAAMRGNIASFGPFRLRMTERLLEKDGTAQKIGSRALDILMVLLEHAPAVVSKSELIRRVWGKLVVDEVSLRFNIAALRKRLRAGDAPVRYISNIPGRGYCFTGTVSWAETPGTPGKVRTSAAQLPREPLLMVGRDDAVRELTTLLKKQRFVSIVGAGGIGKTTIALTLAHRMLADFEGAVHLLDLGAVDDPRLLESLLASKLGLVAVSERPLPIILTFLREQRMLLVFDSCEHLIEAMATLAEKIFCAAPSVYILVTSREALRAEGEQVHHLPPLECPPYTESLTAKQALGFPAVQLFVKQVTHSGHPLELTDADAPIVAEICRRLDGIALALELAASRVGVHGIRGTASLLDKQFRLLWRGRRTALPRHQTLSATLDWSYNLLSATEQQVLRRLAVFVGSFSLEAALDVVAATLAPAELTETLATLVDKSLVTSDSATATRYRLLDTTRAYAWQKLTESGEDSAVLRGHCEYVVRGLNQFKATIWLRPNPASVDFFVLNLGNLRAALEWSFSAEGDTGLAAKLAGESACFFFQAGLMPECATWTERALSTLDTASKGTQVELELLACFASSLMVTRGNLPTIQSALLRALDIADDLNVAPMQLYLLHALYKWQIRSGDLRGFAELTRRVETVAEPIADPLADAIAHGFRAVTCFFTADNRAVGRHAHIALTAPVHLSSLNFASFGHLHRVRVILARNSWVLGFPEQAMATNEEAVQEAENLNHPFTLCYILMSCVLVPLETGNWHRAAELLQRLSAVATKHHLLTYARAAVGWEGCLAVLRGDLPRGIDLLQTAIVALHEDGYELYRPHLSIALAEGLAKTGRRELALRTICEALGWTETRGRILNSIDQLRVKGELLGSLSPEDASAAEMCFLQSLQLARERGLLSLELRTGTRLARLWAAQAQQHRALGLLEPIFNRFSEGFQTRDLIDANNLLQQLRSRG
jgi:predicted ATPase/DNA-binding winged helix-turn-helix (wHTH) protein